MSEEIRELERKAIAGDAKSCHNLAKRYAEGRDVPQSHEMAAIWYTKAANLGYSDSMYNLSIMYANGEGVPLDYTKSSELMAKVALLGDEDAINIVKGVLGANWKQAAYNLVYGESSQSSSSNNSGNTSTKQTTKTVTQSTHEPIKTDPNIIEIGGTGSFAVYKINKATGVIFNQMGYEIGYIIEHIHSGFILDKNRKEIAKKYPGSDDIRDMNDRNIGKLYDKSTLDTLFR